MASFTEREADDWQIRDTECADSLRELLTKTLQIIITPGSAAQNKAEEEKVAGKPVLMRAQTPPVGLSLFSSDQDPVRRCDEIKEQKRSQSPIR